MRDRMQEEFADVRVALPETIRRAAQQAGAQPVTSMAELSADVSSNSTLCTAFQQEINETIRQRIANDPEYAPEKYPNTEKYFNSKKPWSLRWCVLAISVRGHFAVVLLTFSYWLYV